MLNRYSVNFDNMLWRNLRISIRKKSSSSIWYKFLYAIFRFFEEKIIEIVNYLYDQIFLEHASYDSLIKTGKEYKVYPRSGESQEEYKNRLQIKKTLVNIPPSVELIKRFFQLYLDVSAEVIQGRDYKDNLFTIGVTPIGTGICVDSMYYRFAYEVILPDLSGETIDREYLALELENYNFGGNEFIIKENRPEGYYTW